MAYKDGKEPSLVPQQCHTVHVLFYMFQLYHLFVDDIVVYGAHVTVLIPTAG